MRMGGGWRIVPDIIEPLEELLLHLCLHCPVLLGQLGESPLHVEGVQPGGLKATAHGGSKIFLEQLAQETRETLNRKIQLSISIYLIGTSRFDDIGTGTVGTPS
jgi:hypothetical protein